MNLEECGFVNGKPDENTWEKNPKAMFWWCFFCTDAQYYRPYYGHHCGSKQRKEQMLNMLSDALEYIR
jgi:hypothetical protein